jgi:hypothetical protein
MGQASTRGALVCIVSCIWMMAACSTPQLTNSVAAVTGTVVMGHTPTTNLSQKYYLGVFDPREQLPPTIYRITVQGQGSALAWTKFASGWVRADLVDSLSSRVDMERGGVRVGEADNGRVKITDDKSALNRRLVMFGPEGFREAPKNHRLVVVMGSNPDAFFGAVDRALGVVAGVTQPSQSGPDVVRALWGDMTRMREERRAMQTLLDVAGKE